MADPKKAPPKSKATAEAVGKHIAAAHKRERAPAGYMPAAGKPKGRPTEQQRQRAKRSRR